MPANKIKFYNKDKSFNFESNFVKHQDDEILNTDQFLIKDH
jgi:hypothetical protein